MASERLCCFKLRPLSGRRVPSHPWGERAPAECIRLRCCVYRSRFTFLANNTPVVFERIECANTSFVIQTVEFTLMREVVEDIHQFQNSIFSSKHCSFEGLVDGCRRSRQGKSSPTTHGLVISSPLKEQNSRLHRAPASCHPSREHRHGLYL